MAGRTLHFTRRHMDRAMPPEQRRRVWARTSDVARTRPLLFAFLLVQLATASVPVMVFVGFVAWTGVVAVGAACVATLFWAGVAAAVLVPALLVAGAVAVAVWACGVACFVVARCLWGLMPEPPLQPNGVEPDEQDVQDVQDELERQRQERQGQQEQQRQNQQQQQSSASDATMPKTEDGERVLFERDDVVPTDGDETTRTQGGYASAAAAQDAS